MDSLCVKAILDAMQNCHDAVRAAAPGDNERSRQRDAFADLTRAFDDLPEVL